MTWDQDQVDSFMKSYNWTNFEQKSCRMSTSIGTLTLRHLALPSSECGFESGTFYSAELNN